MNRKNLKNRSKDFKALHLNIKSKAPSEVSNEKLNSLHVKSSRNNQDIFTFNLMTPNNKLSTLSQVRQPKRFLFSPNPQSQIGSQIYSPSEFPFKFSMSPMTLLGKRPRPSNPFFEVRTPKQELHKEQPRVASYFATDGPHAMANLQKELITPEFAGNSLQQSFFKFPEHPKSRVSSVNKSVVGNFFFPGQPKREGKPQSIQNYFTLENSHREWEPQFIRKRKKCFREISPVPTGFFQSIVSVLENDRIFPNLLYFSELDESCQIVNQVWDLLRTKEPFRPETFSGNSNYPSAPN